jgi:hypothetical protein
VRLPVRSSVLALPVLLLALVLPAPGAAADGAKAGGPAVAAVTEAPD